MYLHPTCAVSTDREPLGILDAGMWAREPRKASGQRGGWCESTRWIESYERLAERAGDLPETRLVQVGDRECDLLALMQRAAGLGWPVDLLVRSQHNWRPYQEAATARTAQPQRSGAPPCDAGRLLARRGDGEPGVKTLWIGLQRVMNFATGVRFMRDSADSVSWVSWNGPNQGPYAMPQNSTRRC